jgi:hypothetical protein
MNLRNTLTASALAAALAIAAPAQAATEYAVTLNIGPPAVVYEPVPQPRVGYVWAPAIGTTATRSTSGARAIGSGERHGQRYVAGEWHEYNGRWGLSRGHWATN